SKSSTSASPSTPTSRSSRSAPASPASTRRATATSSSAPRTGRWRARRWRSRPTTSPPSNGRWKRPRERLGSVDRTERLLNLVALLLGSREPVPFSEIREAFPDDYGGPRDAAERKLERDKAELLTIGVPVEVLEPNADRTERWVRPYGLAFRGGTWRLVSWCELRNDVRTFVVDRIERLEENSAHPNSADFEVPQGFDVSAAAGQQPWQWSQGDTLDVV